MTLQLLAVFLVIAAGHVCSAQVPVEIQKHFEFENALSTLQDDMWVWRSEASNLKALRLLDPNGSARIEFTLCIEPLNVTQNVTLYVDDIRYSNDGPSDNVTLRFNGKSIANFTTVEKWMGGHEWNLFRNSGKLGAALSLRQGQHSLMITVRTDRWGIEMDLIRINAENQNPMKELFCGAIVYSV